MNRTAAATLASTEATALELADELASLLVRGHITELGAAATAETARLRRAVLTVAILGEFKRGKSSLINALIGRDLLPVGALPLTSVGTRLEYGDEVRVTVELLDGHRARVEPAAIPDYATERGNPGNRRHVASVTIATPAPVLRGPLDLVDTPGIGSAFADVTATARAWMAQADIALVVLSAEQPASRRELDFLRETLAAGLPVVVVENKIDLVPEAERDQVINFVRTQVRQLREGAAVPIFAVSSDEARRAEHNGDEPALAASGVPALEAALVDLAQRDGISILVRAARRRLIQIAERAVAARQLQSRAAPLAGFWHEQRQAHLRQQVSVVVLRDLLDAKERGAAAADAIARSLGQQSAEATAERRLEAYLATAPIESDVRSVRLWAADLETGLRRELDSLVNQWSDREHNRLRAAATDVTADWRARIAEALSPIVGVPPSIPLPGIDFPAPSVAIPASRLARPLLLPGTIGRRQARRRVRRWLRATLPALLQARRAAVSRNIAAALQRAEERWHECLIASLNPMLAHAAAPPNAADDPIDTELQSLRNRLREAGDGG